jgi:hypothetical protein
LGTFDLVLLALGLPILTDAKRKFKITIVGRAEAWAQLSENRIQFIMPALAILRPGQPHKNSSPSLVASGARERTPFKQNYVINNPERRSFVNETGKLSHPASCVLAG